MSLCHFHDGVTAQAECSACQKPLCNKCIKRHDEQIYCRDCAPAKKRFWKNLMNVIGEAIEAVIRHS